MRSQAVSRALTAFLLVITSSLPASAGLPKLPVSHLLLSELMTGTTASASAEFVEIYNPSNLPLSLDCVKLQYKSAIGGGWTNKAELSGELLPREYYLIGTDKFLEGLPETELNGTMSAGLSATGGHLRLLLPDAPGDCASTTYVDESVADLIGWGNADQPETAAAVVPAKDHSLKRLFDEDGLMIDTNQNAQDWLESDSPFPEHQWAEADVPVEEPATEPEPAPATDPATYLSLEISEVMPDPDSPQTDAEDEYVELFNPNSTSVNLKDYVLKTGSSLQYQHRFEELTLAPHTYRAFFSEQVAITLSNSGSKVLLVDPSGSTASNLVTYETAVAGESWSKVGQTWVWSDRLTPSAANLAHSPASSAATTQTGATTTQNLRSYPKAILTELLPDPEMPQKDADGEFVEIYNPNNSPLDLTGYTLRTGSTLRTKQTFTKLVIPARSFIAVFNSDTSMSLANSGGSAQLLDPNGKEVSKTAVYGAAKPGLAWALIKGTWQWTSTPTPAAANTLTAPRSQATTTGTQASAGSTSSSFSSPLGTPAIVPPSPYSRLFVVGTLGLALLYALYEYRFDLRNQLELRRRHAKARRASRAKA